MERAGPAWRPQVQRERFARGSSRSARASSSCPTRSCAAFARGGEVGGDKACKGFVGARVVLGHDGLAQSAKGEAETRRAAHDAAGHEGGKRDAKRHAEAQPAAGDTRGGLPPKVIRQIVAERGAHGGSHLPVKGSQQIMIEQDCARTRPCIGETPATESELFLWTSAKTSSNMSSNIWAWCWTLLFCSFALSAVSTTSVPRCIAPIYKSHHLSGTDEGQLCATLDTRCQTWQTMADVTQSAMSQWYLPQTVRLRAVSFLHTRHTGCSRVHQVPTLEVFLPPSQSFSGED